MAKVVVPCAVCGGKGRKLRDAGDRLRQFCDEEVCDKCGGSGKVAADISVEERPPQTQADFP